MEIAPGAAMTINGPVHGNGNVYLEPQNALTFGSTVSTVGSNVLDQSPLDPTTSRRPGRAIALRWLAQPS